MKSENESNESNHINYFVDIGFQRLPKKQRKECFECLLEDFGEGQIGKRRQKKRRINGRFPSPSPHQNINPSIHGSLTRRVDDGYILSRLPVKTIIHCKLVCKKWRNLVSDSSFVNLHFSRSPTCLIIHYKFHNPSDPVTLKWVELQDKVDHHRLCHDPPMGLRLNMLPIYQHSLMYQVGSVNGLICLWQYSSKFNRDHAYICNPVTREYVILPRRNFWEERLQAVVYGFGVMVRAFQACPSVLEAEVYTLGTCQWRSLGSVPVTYRLNTFKEFYGPFLNNRCHWIVSDNKDAHDDKICTFDLDKETFQLLPSPPPQVKKMDSMVKGCLCKLDTYDSKLTIWVMKEYGINNSWCKQVVIRRTIPWPLFEPIHLIADLKDGSFLMVFENKLCVFDPQSQTIEDTKIFYPSLSGWAYRPSFLKLHNFDLERVYTFSRSDLMRRLSQANHGREENLRLRTLIDPSMEDLPAELTMDILSRLPVKTIIHCKRVCKKWRNLVSDSSFVNLHLSRSPTCLIIHHNPVIYVNAKSYMNDYGIIPNNPGISKWVEIEDKVDHHHLHYDRLLSLDLRNWAPIQQYTQMRQVGSVNGLICLLRYFSEHHNTYICNPVTREYMILLGRFPQEMVMRDSFMVLGSLSGEYKVVWSFQTEVVGNGYAARPSVLKAEVYTLGTGHWRSLGPVPVTCWHNTFHQFYGPFLNNHCHWIASDNEICTFDLDKETFQLLPSRPPPVKSIWINGESLAILKGCLCKLDTYHSELTIWVMKEYGIKNSWHREVVIRREICVTPWPLYGPIHLIAGLKDGCILMLCRDKLCVYDPQNETMKDTKMFDRDLRGLTYCPSFLKLHNFELEMVRMFVLKVHKKSTTSVSTGQDMTEQDRTGKNRTVVAGSSSRKSPDIAGEGGGGRRTSDVAGGSSRRSPDIAGEGGGGRRTSDVAGGSSRRSPDIAGKGGRGRRTSQEVAAAGRRTSSEREAEEVGRRTSPEVAATGRRISS
ncbi:LOW QUALITY PROTEIN: hypothetical protein OSB04_un000232 [Centaurea solstitialis]|uniref:F-box domain-containing protein n=1 Tax=Centaurea solstitialis TaxID=347529 RepID=A0AA38SD17_9ASTR|nr:LOW QUALITY PROTEIN: hypothetical protein OSB04_un000232 [Centaurea solstitialis]